MRHEGQCHNTIPLKCHLQHKEIPGAELEEYDGYSMYISSMI